MIPERIHPNLAANSGLSPCYQRRFSDIRRAAALAAPSFHTRTARPGGDTARKEKEEAPNNLEEGPCVVW
jgi:hypothetical protein